MLITAADLASTMGANALMLVGDGEGFRVLNVFPLPVSCGES
jgi:hypothetical protein